MTQEEKKLLVSLLNKANENSVLHIYDSEENTYEIKWIFIDRDVCIKLNTL